MLNQENESDSEESSDEEEMDCNEGFDALWPDPLSLKTTNDLAEYFEKQYRAGGEFQHPDYEDDKNGSLWTWKHKPTGIKVWKDAIDLTKGHGGEVYFHYTSELAFRNITHPAKEAVEVWASLRTSGPNANAWWGKGIYTVPFPPDQWKDREQLLDNNFRNMMKRDSKDPERGPKYVEREYPKRAAFCVPIIINAINAFDVSKRPTPEMEQEGKKPGTNLADKLLNEPNMPTRWCVVLRVSGDGASKVQNACGRLETVLRQRAGATDGLDAKGRLGNVLHQRGLLEEAFKIHDKLLEMCQTQFGPEHPDTLTSMSNLALVLNDMGKLKEAAELHRTALEVRAKIFGRDHPATVISMNNLANVLKHMGNVKEAAELHRTALEVFEKILGREHPNTLASMNNLANVLEDMGKLKEAEKLHRTALEVQKRYLAPDHPATVISMNNLAFVLRGMGKLKEAAELHRTALEVQEKKLGPKHPSTLTSKNNLAFALHDMAKLKEAAELGPRVS